MLTFRVSANLVGGFGLRLRLPHFLQGIHAALHQGGVSLVEFFHFLAMHLGTSYSELD
jgi:hypothetical protein